MAEACITYEENVVISIGEGAEGFGLTPADFSQQHILISFNQTATGGGERDPGWKHVKGLKAAPDFWSQENEMNKTRLRLAKLQKIKDCCVYILDPISHSILNFISSV